MDALFSWLKGKSLVLLIIILGLGSVAFDVGSALMSRIGDGLFIGAMFLVFYLFTSHKNKKFDELRDANAILALDVKNKEGAITALNNEINTLRNQMTPVPGGRFGDTIAMLGGGRKKGV